MKIHAQETAAPTKPASAPGQFQRVLQQTGARQALAPTHPQAATVTGKSPPGPAAALGAGKLPPGHKAPSGAALQPPPSALRLPTTTLPAGPILATARSALATPENLGHVRLAMHGEARRLSTVRSESQTVAQERTEHRVSELISRELAREYLSEPVQPPRTMPLSVEPTRGASLAEGLTAPSGEFRLAGNGASAAPAQAPSAQLKAEAALELIEKIELFVRSQRPALRMSLGGGLAAAVEVERTGPREVALRLQGRHGPLAQEEISRLQGALEARGLRLRSLRTE